MNKVTLFFIFFLLFEALYAQKKTLSGSVVDKVGKPLSFTTITLYSSLDTQHIRQQKIANEDGTFLIDVDSLGTYMLKASLVGYKDFFSKVNVDNLNYNIGKISLLNQENVMDNVTVVAKRPLISKKIDRIVMDVSGNAAATGKSSMDLLKMAPGVLVSNGNILINGTSGGRIMINGKILLLSGSDLSNYLQNLKASDIEAIEIIAHPSAEYDASGSGGLINIVLKRVSKSGFNGSVAFDYGIGLGKYPKYYPSFNFGYRKGKVSFSGGYNYSTEKEYAIIDQERQLPDNNYYRSHTYSDYWRISHNLKFEGTYDISKRQYISLYYIYQPKHGSDSVYSNSNVISRLPMNNIFSTGTFPNSFDSRYSNVGLNYSIQTDTSGSKFTFVADYTNFNKDANSYTYSKTYNSNNNEINDTTFGFFYPNISKILTSNVSFNKIFSKSLSFSLGGKLTKTDISNDNYYNIFSNGLWNEPKELDLNYRYYEDIYAGYVNLKGDFKGIDFQAGLRGEQSNINGKVNAHNKDTTLSSSYFNLFPTLHLLKNLDSKKDFSLTLSYNKRIERPTYSALTPYRYYIDNYSVQEGNPYLKPQFTNAFDVGLSYKQKYNVSLGYNYTNDVISTVIKTDPNDATMIVSTENVGKNKVYSANFSASVKIAQWWNTTNNLLLTHTLSNSPAFQLKQSSFLIQSAQDVQISKRTNLNINAYYTPHVLTGNIITNRISSVDLGFSMKFLNDRLLAKAAISDIFYTDNFKAASYYYGSKLNLGQKLQTRVFSLSLIYNFKIGKAFEAKQIQKSNEYEQNRLK